MRRLNAPLSSPDNPLIHLLGDARTLNDRPLDALWVRLVDVDRALAPGATWRRST